VYGGVCPASDVASVAAQRPENLKFLCDAFSQPSSNSKKIQINTNWNWYENPSLKPSNFQVIYHRLYFFLRKIGNKHLRSNVWPCNRVS
jgi:hypothetical protein